MFRVDIQNESGWVAMRHSNDMEEAYHYCVSLVDEQAVRLVEVFKDEDIIIWEGFPSQ